MIAPIASITVGLDFGNMIKTVGRLTLRKHKIYFEYDAGYLSDGFELSPIRLPLKSGLTICDSSVFDGLPGLFNDSLPDGWGRLLFDRAMHLRGIKLDQLTPLHQLAHVGKSGMGALVYKPDNSQNIEPAELNLDQLSRHCTDVLEGDAEDVINELLLLNGSSGGARPKVLIGYNQKTGRVIHGTQKLPKYYEHWIVKFQNSQDGPDAGAIEFVYSKLAAAARISVPDVRLFPSKLGAGYFAVKRFDRTEGKRLHMHTAGGLLHSDHRIPTLDYHNLLELTMFLMRDVRELYKMFQLAVFNVMAHNRDDHSKNFTFLMDETGEWKLSPAYDLTFSHGPGGEHSTMIMGEGDSPSRDDLRALGSESGLSNSQIKEAIDHTQAALEMWRNLARNYHVSQDSLNEIDRVITKFVQQQ